VGYFDHCWKVVLINRDRFIIVLCVKIIMNSNRSIILFTLALVCLAYIGSCRDDPSKWPSPGPSSVPTLTDQK
jgi:hypothetical protein